MTSDIGAAVTGYFLEGIDDGQYHTGPFFTERAAQTAAQDLDKDVQVMPEDVEFSHRPTDISTGLNRVYEALSSVDPGDRTIDVPLYNGDSDPDADPVDTLPLHVDINEGRAVFWVDSSCDCCQTRPEIAVTRDVGTLVAFRSAVNDFLVKVLSGTAPRQHPDVRSLTVS